MSKQPRYKEPTCEDCGKPCKEFFERKDGKMVCQKCLKGPAGYSRYQNDGENTKYVYKQKYKRL